MYEEVLNTDFLIEHMNSELIVSEVWFCRDSDGTCCTYGTDCEPQLDHSIGMWCAPDNRFFNITTDTDSTRRKYGKGTFGVKAGTKKIIKLVTLK